LKAVAALLLATAACDGLIRPEEQFSPESDVLTIGAVIVAGQGVAYLLASHPHRLFGEEPPVVAATLSGPGWEAPYADSVPLRDCGVFVPEQWAGPAVCLRAQLQEPVREGVRYSLAGTTALGAFRGETTVPAPPVIRAPADTVRMRVASSAKPARVDLRFETAPEVGTVTTDVTGAVQLRDGEEPKNSWVKFTHPLVLDIGAGSQHVDVHGSWVRPGFRFNLHLLGFERNYSLFVERRRENILTRPWPSFGLTGDEGIYGYFGAGARSRAIPVALTVGS
jgi:hypothetical protein